MDHHLLLVQVLFNWRVELRLDYCLFSPCVMSQLDRTEAFSPEHWNSARAPSQTAGPWVTVFPLSAQWSWYQLCVTMCMSIGGWRAYLFSPSLLFDSFPLKRVWNIVISGQTPFSQRVIESCQLAIPRVSNASCRKISHCFRMTSGIY